MVFAIPLTSNSWSQLGKSFKHTMARHSSDWFGPQYA